MKNFKFLAITLFSIILLASCNRNYYSGSGKGGKNCGCPNTRGMSGY